MRLSDIDRDFSLVIFDYDGTLVDSMWMWEAIDIEWLARFGVDYSPSIQHDIEGMSIEEIAVYCRESLGIMRSTEEMRADWVGMSYDKYAHEVLLKPHAGEFLRFLKSRGVSVAVASSSAIENIMVSAEHNAIESFVDLIVTTSDVPRGKPFPDVFLEAARRLSVSPEECIVFEDVPAGIMAARAADMYVVAVYDDFSAEFDEEKRFLADKYIYDFGELLP